MGGGENGEKRGSKDRTQSDRGGKNIERDGEIEGELAER